MFRYERPQKGRFRQFHQIDMELIGVRSRRRISSSSPSAPIFSMRSAC